MACGVFLTGSLLLSGCTKKFEGFNTDNTAIPNNLLKAGGLIIGMQLSIYGEQNAYQLDQNLNADCYSGYMMSPDPFRGNVNNLTYFLVDGWNSSPWTDTYSLETGVWWDLLQSGVNLSAPDQYAVALILKVEAMDRLTDKFGALPYTTAGTNPEGVAFNGQDTVYLAMFADLDTAVGNLQTYVAAHPGVEPLASYDLTYQGNYVEWIKFANSLRLRLAMHIVKADATTAQAQAEKAITNSGGLLSSPSDDATISGGGYINPLSVISTSWTDISMGADFGCTLNGYHDPRLAVMCMPATQTNIAGQYEGIRLGSLITQKPGYTGFSILNTNTCVSASSPMRMMTAAEVDFLMAEGALRNWPGFGSAQTWYNQGITTSFLQWGVSGAAAYYGDATSVPTAYVDPNNSANNSPAVEGITIAWDAAATNEENLERIITQKWIAMFPEGQEAWTEQRRTGYPHLLTAVTNNSGGTISSTIGIRRLAYPQSIYLTNTVNINAAVANTLGGADNGGTRLWWDINKGNF